MTSSESSSAGGLVLALSGLVVVALCQLIALRSAVVPASPLLAVAVVAGFCGLGVGIYRLGICRAEGRPETPRPAGGAAASARPTVGGAKGDEIARRMVTAFIDWLREQPADGRLWGAFDQLIRELLTEHLSATRVRCYQALPGVGELRGLSHAGLSGGDGDRIPRAGILGHVATTGREFVAGNPAHGKLVDELASATDESWAWVWPVRVGHTPAGGTTGLVAVGKLPSGSSLDRERCQVIGPLIDLFWGHVAALEELRVAQQTDKVSGVLTRSDFFKTAARALAESYEQNEPLVVVVLALEGLRGLDDVGMWKQRDALVETLGQLVAQRVRTDDVVGRFSDDRFVILLRRIDSGLGRLIAEKIVATTAERIAGLGDTPGPICARAGLAGSGLGRPALQTLLAGAAQAVQQARRQDVPVCGDLPSVAQGAVAP